MSAHVRTDRDRSVDGRFEIVYDRRDDDDPWGSDISESWQVVDVRAKRTMWSFHGTSRWRESGHTTDGVKFVAFDPDGVHVVATHHDGTVERRALPPP